MKKLIMVAIVANSATIFSKYIIELKPGVGSADYIIPIFVWPILWLFSIIIASKIKTSIFSSDNKQNPFLENLAFLFCTPLPILMFFFIY